MGKKVYYNLEYDRKKYRVAIIAPFPPLSGGMTQIAQSLSRNLKKDGHKIYKIDLGKGLNGVFPFPKLYIKYFKIISRCDIVHIISASGNALWFKDLPAILVSRFMFKKAILNFVGGMALDYYDNWSWFKKLPFRLADIVVVPTDIFKNLLNKDKLCSKVFTVPHVVDVQNFNENDSLSHDKPVLIASKALEKYAGIYELLDIFYEVKKKIKNLEFWIIGDGPERERLINKVNRMRLKDVRFLGQINHREMPKIMKEGTIFVHATRFESFGLVLVEAMASSLPIISFRVGGIPEVVLDKKTGFLIEYGNQNHFSEAIQDLIFNFQKRKRFKDNAKKHSRNYHWNKVKKYWYKIYFNLKIN
ncbi:MAG: glycosyltransferase family 4 protein [Candidatus Neomarinimicrobiota bacterium]